MVSYRTLLVILAIFLPIVSCSLIDSTCKQTPNYKMCASVLQNDPKSSSSDVSGLALIMVSSLKSKSISAVHTINQLLKTKPRMKVPLNECLKHYNFILRYDITEAVEALTKGDPKFAEDATRDAAFVVQECEDGFKPSPSPISSINKVAHDTADVATSIVRQLL